MAIISVTEDFRGLAAHDRIQPDGIKRGDTRRFFDVQFDEADQAALRPILALTNSAVDPTTGVKIPQLGDSHPYGVWIYVLDRRATVTVKSPFVYRAVILYDEIRDPVNEPARIEWFSASTNEPVSFGFDDDGNRLGLLTTSDEPFDPPPMVEIDDLVVRATYSTDIFNPVVASAYQKAVNDRPIMIRGFVFPTGSAKVVTYTATENRAIINQMYFDIVVEIQFRNREEGWKTRFPNLGYRTKEGIVGGIQKYKNIKVDPENDNSDDITEPVGLDNDGQRLSPLLLAFREFWLNDRLNFASVFGAFLS